MKREKTSVGSHVTPEYGPAGTVTTLAEKRAEYAKDLQRALNKIVSHLANMPQLEQVILFGSYAAGRRDLFTDLDLIVVVHSEQDFVHRTAELYQQRQRGFVRQALRTGRVLYEKKPVG